MSVLIKGMGKPEHCGYCRFRYDGICHALQKTQYSMNECPLVVIDDAGLNDTISRQAAIDALGEEPEVWSGNDEYALGLNNQWHYDTNALKALPSAEKKGKWIIKETRTFELAYGTTGYEPVYECSECGRETESYLRLDEPIMPEDADFPRFCQHCGARMEE